MTPFILIISAVYPPEPVVSARISADLYHALKERGHEVRVMHPRATRPYGFQFDVISNIGVDEIVANSYTCAKSSIIGRTRESISFGYECAKYIRKYRDFISLVYTGVWPLFGQYQVMRMCVRYHIPTVSPVQDVYPESLSNKMKGCVGRIVQKAFLPMDKYILKHSDRIHVISNKMRDYLAETRNISLDKFTVVINWQDETDFLEYQKAVTPEVHDKFTMMYMGNIGPVAGVDLLIDAFERAQLCNARLVIAGTGSMKESLKEKAKDNQNIEFWDVPNGKVPEIQSKADVMLLPIKKGAALSSIPSKLPAYMFSAKPIIGCVDNDSDTADAIHDSKGGFVIAPERPDCLATIMQEVASMDKSDLIKKGQNAQEYGLEHFSKKANLKKLVDVIITTIKR